MKIRRIDEAGRWPATAMMRNPGRRSMTRLPWAGMNQARWPDATQRNGIGIGRTLKSLRGNFGVNLSCARHNENC
jgi:hypothetical protein